MLLEPWWYVRNTPRPNAPLSTRATCDVVVIGGGVAGLHTALSLVQQGADVVLLERSFCGGGMSGKSSGFLTPDSELDLHNLTLRYGLDDAATLWEIVTQGVQLIVSTAQNRSIACELLALDSLLVGIGRTGADRVDAEVTVRAALDYPYTQYSSEELRAVHAGNYSAGVCYNGTWAIDPLAYCSGVRAALVNAGVRIYEGTEVTSVRGTEAITPNGFVSAGSLVSCMNQIPKRISQRAYRQSYHAQTYLSVSEPLSSTQIEALFPAEPLQVWDSSLVYSYHRLTGDNRLLLGGGSPLTTFSPWEIRSPHIIESVIERFKARVPSLREVTFERFWPGLIDVTHDLLPIAAADPENPAVYYVLGCAGLPWAAWCGDHVARLITHQAKVDVHRFFGWSRQQVFPGALQSIVGRPLRFAVDVLRAKMGRPRWNADSLAATGMKADTPGD